MQKNSNEKNVMHFCKCFKSLSENYLLKTSPLFDASGWLPARFEWLPGVEKSLVLTKKIHTFALPKLKVLCLAAELRQRWPGHKATAIRITFAKATVIEGFGSSP